VIESKLMRLSWRRHTAAEAATGDLRYARVMYGRAHENVSENTGPQVDRTPVAGQWVILLLG